MKFAKIRALYQYTNQLDSTLSTAVGGQALLKNTKNISEHMNKAFLFRNKLPH